jgi:hypothetical protein
MQEREHMQTTMEVGCKQEASDLLDRYVTCLDERRFDEWLDLFADDAFYSMLLHKDYVQDTNMLAIGEDKKRLAGRIEVAQGIERDLVTHMLTAVTAEEAKDGAAAVRASANFAVIRKGAIHCSGRWREPGRGSRSGAASWCSTTRSSTAPSTCRSERASSSTRTRCP